ncbi:zf-CCHC domain-containing protein/RVP_2 domain-containing protein [Gossypium australe]|uniref:Zf-CCHC domain-containing protein/RVP_2 domain-containing protein n=1 Tax=Gossypium australe TaxID=47621 RepID=A0A5B6VAK6_9ROSI|nr:zf-CCHC domain-containing protein/RVP_2 domain-containing protein [Gossypium australe]
MNKPYHSLSKKSRDSYSRSNASMEYSNRDRGKQFTGSKTPAMSVASVDEKDKSQNTRQSNTIPRGRPFRNVGNVSGGRGATRDAAVRSEARALARTYAICAREEASSPDVITSTFFLYETDVVALIDPGSTHSYICVNLVSSKNLFVDSTEFVIKVLNPLGKYVLVDKVCKNCPLMTRGYCFMADLMLLSFDEFDVILGMDWLKLHDAVGLPAVILSMLAQKYVKKGCNACLAYVLNTKVSETKIELVPVVYEYLDVFPEELLGLPPIREVEFAIDLIPGTSPISIAPYKMAQTELKELKAQLQKLIDRGFARPSFSP